MIKQVDREDNGKADALSKLAALREESGCPTEEAREPYINTQRVVVIQASPKDWVDDLTDYIEKGELPEDENKARNLRKKAARYTVQGGILYRRSFVRPLLRCIRPTEVIKILSELHGGICGGHPGARSLSDKALITGYYWPSLRRDAEEYVKKCDKCQRYSNIPRLPSTEQTPVLIS